MSRLSKKLRQMGLYGALPPKTVEECRLPDNTGVETSDPLSKAFNAHGGYRIWKWHHYLPLYDRYLQPYRDRSAQPVRLLELGVFKGGSLQLWREYFGASATIFGIDIDQSCQALDGVSGGQVRIGSQTDDEFLRAVVAEAGGIDIVIDDGSHNAAHMNKSFDILFPLLSDGGLYVVEDLHCAYWRFYGGGYRRRGTFIERSKQLIDDMHHWWHKRGQGVAAAANRVAGVHFHDSIVFIEKADRSTRPVCSEQGNI